MPPFPAGSRPELQRTNSWPPTTRINTDVSTTNRPRSESTSAPAQIGPARDAFEDDLEDHPEAHFLSPMYEYEDWAEDDDDDDEVEWDAGITDFALFDVDRRRAQESHEPLPSRWNNMIRQQASALQRAVQRNRADSTPDPRNRLLFTEDVPSLTPDDSPDLRDDLDFESFDSQEASRPSMSSQLTVIVTAPEEDDNDYAVAQHIEDASLSFPHQQVAKREGVNRRLERPGLRHSRTLSGKVHTWRRPSWQIYPVREDPRAEEIAELDAGDDEEDEDEDEDRGRSSRLEMGSITVLD